MRHGSKVVVCGFRFIISFLLVICNMSPFNNWPAGRVPHIDGEFEVEMNESMNISTCIISFSLMVFMIRS